MKNSELKKNFWTVTITKFSFLDRIRILFGYTVRHELIIFTQVEIEEAEVLTQVTVTKYKQTAGVSRAGSITAH